MKSRYLIHILVAKALAMTGMPVNGLTLSIASLAAAAALLVAVAAPLKKIRQRRIKQALSKHNSPRQVVEQGAA